MAGFEIYDSSGDVIFSDKSVVLRFVRKFNVSDIDHLPSVGDGEILAIKPSGWSVYGAEVTCYIFSMDTPNVDIGLYTLDSDNIPRYLSPFEKYAKVVGVGITPEGYYSGEMVFEGYPRSNYAIVIYKLKKWKEAKPGLYSIYHGVEQYLITNTGFRSRIQGATVNGAPENYWSIDREILCKTGQSILIVDITGL